MGAIFQDFLRYELTAGHNIGLGRPQALDLLGLLDDPLHRLTRTRTTPKGKAGNSSAPSSRWASKPSTSRAGHPAMTAAVTSLPATFSKGHFRT